MADIVFNHTGDMSPDFFTTLCLHEPRIDDNIKNWKGGSIRDDIPNLSPRVTVINAKKPMRQYNKEPNLYAVYNLHVLDGSDTIMRAVTDTRLSRIVLAHSNTLVPGATLILKDFAVVSCTSPSATWKKIILIKDMSWRIAPNYNMAPVRSGMTPSPPQERPVKKIKSEEEEDNEVKSCRIAWRALHKAERESQVVFTHPVLDQPEIYIWNTMMNAEVKSDDIHKGEWILDPNLCKEWMDEFDPKKFIRDDSSEEYVRYPDDGLGPFRPNCECVQQYQLTHCALQTVPVWTMDGEALLTAGQGRCYADEYNAIFREAECWDDLPNNSKRWCCYFWYATNIFSLRGQCQKLPDCVVYEIRKTYPNEKGRKYTGFKSKEERSSGV
jgi:hypothetical protein